MKARYVGGMATRGTLEEIEQLLGGLLEDDLVVEFDDEGCVAVVLFVVEEEEQRVEELHHLLGGVNCTYIFSTVHRPNFSLFLTSKTICRDIVCLLLSQVDISN